MGRALTRGEKWHMKREFQEHASEVSRMEKVEYAIKLLRTNLRDTELSLIEHHWAKAPICNKISKAATTFLDEYAEMIEHIRKGARYCATLAFPEQHTGVQVSEAEHTYFSRLAINEEYERQKKQEG